MIFFLEDKITAFRQLEHNVMSWPSTVYTQMAEFRYFTNAAKT